MEGFFFFLPVIFSLIKWFANLDFVSIVMIVLVMSGPQSSYLIEFISFSILNNGQSYKADLTEIRMYG